MTLQRYGVDADGLESIYGSVPRTLEHFELDKKQIDVQETLGKYFYITVNTYVYSTPFYAPTLKDGAYRFVVVSASSHPSVPSSVHPKLVLCITPKVREP
jgi:hypothetical protein